MTKTEEEAFEKATLERALEQTEAEILGWRASDGGLTIAACDALDDVAGVRRYCRTTKDVFDYVGDNPTIAENIILNKLF